MRIVTLEGDDQINNALTIAMRQTIDALHQTGLLSTEDATEFIDTHICMALKKNALQMMWDKIAASEDNDFRVSVLKIENGRIGDSDE